MNSRSQPLQQSQMTSGSHLVSTFVQTQNQQPASEDPTIPTTPAVTPVSQHGPAGSPQNHTLPNSGSNGPIESPPPQTAPSYVQPPTPLGALQNNASSTSLPALRPVFGVSLNDLLKRDGSAIPLVVYQCVQAIDLFGLEVEGIYRLSGSAAHVNKLKGIFDNGALRFSCN